MHISEVTFQPKEKSRITNVHKNTKHGLSRSRINKIWRCMKYRCNHDGTRYSSYKGKGITYDPKWEKFEAFFEDMKSGYRDDLSLDRIDNNGNYSKENCRWATVKEQARNRGNNRLFEGKTLSEWAEILGVSRDMLAQRYYSYGWKFEKIITTKNLNLSKTKENAKYK